MFVPVGGGGLLAGVAGYIKAVLPDVRVIGVEPFESDAMYQSLQAGRRVTLDHVGIFADGVAVRTVGVHTFQIAQLAVDEIVRVSNDEMCAAIKDIFDDTRSVMEPAGALVAGRPEALGGAPPACRDQHLVAILSGANMNFDRLRFVAERAELGEEREALFAVTIPERPGAYRDFCVALGQRVVTEFNYRLNGRQEAHIFVGVGIDSRRDAAALAGELNARGYETLDLTDNEMAKLHVRHMVGGAAPDVRLGAALSVRVPRASRGLDQVPRHARRPLEHQPVPLPQPRRRLRPRAGRVRGAGRSGRPVRHLPRDARLSVSAGNRQPGLPAVSHAGAEELPAPNSQLPTSPPGEFGSWELGVGSWEFAVTPP